MKKLPFAFVIIFSFLFLFLSYIPDIYEASQIDVLPPNRVMVWGEHIYTYDYNVYLSKIRQGTEGRSRVVDKYDNHPEQKGVFLQLFYLLSGKAAGFFHLTPVLTFHLLRTVFSVVWVLMIIFINVYFLRRPALFALGVILSFLAASWPVLYQFAGTTWIREYMSWWQEMDVVKHVSYVPHYTFSYISIAGFSFLLYLFEKTKKNKYFAIICLIEFLLFFIQPSGGLLFLLSWVVYYTVKSIWKRKLTFSWSRLLILMAVALVPLLYIKSVTAVYPWKSLIDFEKQNPMPFTLKEYILALGPVFFTGLIGTIIVLIRKEERLLPIAAWILAAFGGMIFFTLIPFQSPLRFVQTANQIPLAILSVYFFSHLWKKNIYIKIITVIIVITIITNGAVQTYFSLKRQTQFIHQRAVADLPLVPYPSQVMYPLVDFWYGIKWLERYTQPTQVVLSKITAGNYIPAYAGNFVYFGHTETPHYPEREQTVNWFFSGTQESAEALTFLKKENIAYVFYGPQEKDNVVNDIVRYPFLTPVYQTPLVTIFQVKKSSTYLSL